jgi:hypothetical protein
VGERERNGPDGVDLAERPSGDFDDGPEERGDREDRRSERRERRPGRACATVSDAATRARSVAPNAEPTNRLRGRWKIRPRSAERELGEGLGLVAVGRLPDDADRVVLTERVRRT